MKGAKMVHWGTKYREFDIVAGDRSACSSLFLLLNHVHV